MYNPDCQVPGGKFFLGLVSLGGFQSPQDELNRLPCKDLFDNLRGFCRFLIRIASGKLLVAVRSPELARHSPEILSRELQCTCPEDSFGTHSLLFGARSPFFGRRAELFEPRELGGMGREGSIGWREGGGMAHSLPFAPLEMEIAAFFLAFGRPEAGGM